MCNVTIFLPKGVYAYENVVVRALYMYIQLRDKYVPL